MDSFQNESPVQHTQLNSDSEISVNRELLSQFVQNLSRGFQYDQPPSNGNSTSEERDSSVSSPSICFIPLSNANAQALGNQANHNIDNSWVYFHLLRACIIVNQDNSCFFISKVALTLLWLQFPQHPAIQKWPWTKRTLSLTCLFSVS